MSQQNELLYVGGERRPVEQTLNRCIGDIKHSMLEMNPRHGAYQALLKVLEAMEICASPPPPVIEGDSWADNAKYLLDRCPHAIRVREGGGPEDLLSSLVVTFQGMQAALAAAPQAQADAQTDLRSVLTSVRAEIVHNSSLMDEYQDWNTVFELIDKALGITATKTDARCVDGHRPNFEDGKNCADCGAEITKATAQACPECPLGPGNPCNEQCE